MVRAGHRVLVRPPPLAELIRPLLYPMMPMIYLLRHLRTHGCRLFPDTVKPSDLNSSTITLIILANLESDRDAMSASSGYTMLRTARHAFHRFPSLDLSVPLGRGQDFRVLTLILSILRSSAILNTTAKKTLCSGGENTHPCRRP